MYIESNNYEILLSGIQKVTTVRSNGVSGKDVKKETSQLALCHF